MTSDSTASVARDITEIVRLHTALAAQTIHKAGDRLMPGGLAMVAIASVSSIAKFDDQLDALERAAIAIAVDLGLDSSTLMPETYEDANWEPPLQTLLFWSEKWRTEKAWPHSKRPELAREANFIRYALDWAHENEPQWDRFKRDIATARARLESILYAGTRAVATGVPCMYDECRGARIVKTTIPTRDKHGRKVWKLSKWHCPRCKRSWTDEDYQALIYKGLIRAKITTFTEDPDTIWCSLDHAATRIGRPIRTIKTWRDRNQIASACTLDRRTFVRWDDIETRDQLARERAQRSIKSKQKIA